jgi:hypothetical protein
VFGGDSLAQMLAQLGKRFDILVSKRPRVIERHHTFWTGIDFVPELQRFFAQLSIFSGEKPKA